MLLEKKNALIPFIFLKTTRLTHCVDLCLQAWICFKKKNVLSYAWSLWKEVFGCYLTATYPGKLFTLNVLGFFPVYLLHCSLFAQSSRDKGNKARFLKVHWMILFKTIPLAFKSQLLTGIINMKFNFSLKAICSK